MMAKLKSLIAIVAVVFAFSVLTGCSTSSELRGSASDCSMQIPHSSYSTASTAGSHSLLPMESIQDSTDEAATNEKPKKTIWTKLFYWGVSLAIGLSIMYFMGWA